MEDNVAGKSIIITGAGSGFGRLTSERLAALGAYILCADINAEAAEATAAGIRAAGGQAASRKADVSQIDDMHALIDFAVAQHGGVDVMVNNAGIMPLAFLEDHRSAHDAWSRCIDINFKGVMNGTCAVYDQMIAQGRGHIINISSIFGNAPVVGSAVYGATKAAVDYFSNSLRQEGRGKIKVTIIKPSGVSATGLGGTVVNGAAAAGIVGQNMGEFRGRIDRAVAGTAPAEWSDPATIDYSSLEPEFIADAIVYAINQPWGIAVSDITVRASGDFYLL